MNSVILIITLYSPLLSGVSAKLFAYPRILNGRNALHGEYPFYVSIESSVPCFISYTCGGTIIDKYWILTAGHCIKRIYRVAKTTVTAGKYKNNSDGQNVQIVKIVKKIIHKKFSVRKKSNDIGLLKLKSALTFNDYVKPVRLPSSKISHEGTAMMVGFGTWPWMNWQIVPMYMQTVSVEILPNDFCKVIIQHYGSNKNIYDSQLCTGSFSTHASASIGDSGGPLVHYRAKHDNFAEPELIGIISWGLEPPTLELTPTIHTRVSHFVDWIYETIKTRN